MCTGVCIFLDRVSVGAGVRLRFVLTDPVMHENVHVVDTANKARSIVKWQRINSLVCFEVRCKAVVDLILVMSSEYVIVLEFPFSIRLHMRSLHFKQLADFNQCC